MLSDAAVQVRTFFVELVVALRLPGAEGGVLSGAKL